MLVINNVNFYFTKVPQPRNGATSTHDRDNIREFTKVPQPRNGATHDRENIREFVKEAGFEKFEEHFDLTKGQMLDLLEKTRLTGDLGEYRLPLRWLPCGTEMTLGEGGMLDRGAPRLPK